jgi:hypothetical protein
LRLEGLERQINKNESVKGSETPVEDYSHGQQQTLGLSIFGVRGRGHI